MAVVFIIVLTVIPNSLSSQTNFIWGKQFGSDREEYVLNHLIDTSGNIYIAGKTRGIMHGQNFGKNDGFITRIDSLGNTIWTRQFGSDGDEDVQWSSIDNSGNIYITGTTTGNLTGKNSGREDIFIIKYDPDGESEWMRQIGTDSSDIAKGIYADQKGYIYITGMTGGRLGQKSFGKTDCFIARLDNTGKYISITQFGTQGDDYCYSITGGPDSDLYVCGSTWGDLAGKNNGFIDGFTGHFTDKGDLIRYNQFGSKGFDIAMIIKVDKDKNIYIGGTTSGNFGGQQIGEGDGFLMKMSENGAVVWNNQFGTIHNDGVRSIDINPCNSDNILVSGILNLPPGQGFVRMYDSAGSLIFERNFTGRGNGLGTSGKDAVFDNRGNFYHLGLTGANLFGKLSGEADVYLVKFELDKSFSKH